MFGSQSKRIESGIKVLNNGGLCVINESLAVKLDPNINNALNISSKGLMSGALKLSRGRVNGDLSMGGYRITDLHPDDPLNPENIASKNYVNDEISAKVVMITNELDNNKKSVHRIH